MIKQERPKSLPCDSAKIPTGCGNMYVIVTRKDGNPFEVFAYLGKAGSCTTCQTEAITRLASLALRYGIPMSEILEDLEGLSCPNPTWNNGELIKSCPDAIAKGIRMIMSKSSEEVK